MTTVAKRTSDPAAVLLTTDEAKAHLRVSSSSEDTLIDGLVSAAREWCEAYTQRTFVSTPWSISLERFPLLRNRQTLHQPYIALPFPRLISVESLTYQDASGASQTLTEGTDFELDLSTEPGRLVPARGKSWPGADSVAAAVTIAYTAGYGATADDVPQTIKQAALMLVGHLYENREAVVIDQGVASIQVPMGVKFLLDPYRVQRVR